MVRQNYPFCRFYLWFSENFYLCKNDLNNLFMERKESYEAPFVFVFYKRGAYSSPVCEEIVVKMENCILEGSKEQYTPQSW